MWMLATAALVAAPALAQTAPPAPQSPPAAQSPRDGMRMRMHKGAMWPSVSPEGRAILRETLRGDPSDRDAMRAARERINTIVGADKLDVGALRRAMEEERRLVDSHHARRQANMLAAIQKLSAADRKAFAEDAQRGRERVEARSSEWRKWAQERQQRMTAPAAPAAPAAPGGSIE